MATNDKPLTIDQYLTALRWVAGLLIAILAAALTIYGFLFPEARPSLLLLAVVFLGAVLVGIGPTAYWLRRRARDVGIDPHFRCQWASARKGGVLTGELHWGLLQVAPNQLIFYHASERDLRADEHWQIQGEDVLGVDGRGAWAEIEISAKDMARWQRFRVRAGHRAALSLPGRLLFHLPLALLLLSFISYAVSDFESMALFLIFVVSLMTSLLIWPGVWLLDLYDARLLRRQVSELAARWPHRQERQRF